MQMSEKKHALLVFTKAPIPGIVKTRLTVENGGIFTPEQAADFYRCCLLDVIEISYAALAELREQAIAEVADSGGTPDTYELFVSTSPESNLGPLKEAIETGGPWPSPMEFIIDSGKTFDEHFDDAFRQIFERGYSSIVAIGGDLPQLPPSHIVQAFQWLDYFSKYSETGGFVHAPCQECGVSIVGYTADTPMDSEGIYYNLDGIACMDGYVAKARERNVPVACLTQVADIDDTGDLAHAVSFIRAMGYSGPHQPGLHVPRWTLWWVDSHGLRIATPPNDLHDPRGMLDV